MRSQRAGLLAVSVALLGCLALVAAEGADWVVKDAAGEKYNITQLRKDLAYESLKDRLEYETQHADRRVSLPAKSKEAWQRLGEFEKETVVERPSEGEVRAKSLAILHGKEVAAFVERSGFGASRLPRPEPRYWQLPAAKPIALKKQRTGDDEQPSAGVVLPPQDEATYRDMRWPQVAALLTFHGTGMHAFVNPIDFGHIKDREHVAGFQPHHFRWMPALAADAKAKVKEQWLLSRLELVSLLKHEKPAVYVSENLPRMQDTRKAKTRSLSAFEDSALQSLTKGEDLVAEASANHIHMMGAVRASKQCLQCHDGQRGDLLGSFSYHLRRDPPLQTGE